MKHKELELSTKHNDFITCTDDTHLKLLSSTWEKGKRKATQSKVLGISQSLRIRGSERIKGYQEKELVIGP